MDKMSVWIRCPCEKQFKDLEEYTPLPSSNGDSNLPSLVTINSSVGSLTSPKVLYEP